MMRLIGRKLYKVLLLFGLLFLAYPYQARASEELNEEPSNEGLLMVVLHPKVVPIENSAGAETVITVMNLGNKPMSLGRVDHKTGKMAGGDYELRVSVDISKAPLRHMQVGELVTVSDDNPFTSANLISGVKFMPGSGLWMAVTALPSEAFGPSEGGEAEFKFTLLGSVHGKIKPLIQMGFTMRYEKGKPSVGQRLIQASTKPDQRGGPALSIHKPSYFEHAYNLRYNQALYYQPGDRNRLKRIRTQA